MISHDLATLVLVLSILGFTFGLIGTILGLLSYVRVLAFEKSTHSITYQPVDEEIDKHNEKILKNNKWATTEAELVKQQKSYKEQLESDLPEFVESDEDKAIHSF